MQRNCSNLCSHSWYIRVSIWYIRVSILSDFPILWLLLSLQSCPTLCNSIDRSPPSSPVPGILQARTLEWVAISFSNAWKWKVKGKLLSRVQLLATPWTAAHQAPPSMGFSRQEYWSGVPLPSPPILSVLQKKEQFRSLYINNLFWFCLWLSCHRRWGRKENIDDI